MTQHRYTVYGLQVDSDVDLPGLPPRSDGAADVSLRQAGTVPATRETPAGEVLLDFETRSRWYTLVRRADGSYLFRVYGLCDYVMSADLHDVGVHPVEGMKPGMDKVMTSGTLLALQLQLRGFCVLHGSGIVMDGASLAFIGQSGRGKSTLAAIMCRDGRAAALTDDVLRIDDLDRIPVTRSGVPELRLRRGADELIGRTHESMSVRRSADERSVLRPGGIAADHVPLRAIVVPRPTKDSDELLAVRYANQDALMILMSFPRLLGWRSPTVLSRTFAQMGRLAKSVPIYAVQIPWGPPFASDLPERLRAAVGWDQSNE